jgi:signal transduction histidine kinase
MMRAGSMTGRLVVSAIVWLIAALAVTFVLLTGLFRNTVVSTFDTNLIDHVDELLSLTQVAPDGHVTLKRHPADPRFNKPKSGWYWSIASSRGWSEHSHSLDGFRLPAVPAPVMLGPDPAPYRISGPGGIEIRVIGKSVTPPGTDQRLTVFVAGPVSAIDAAAARFNGILFLSLAVLGGGLLLAIVFQVRFGLGPLRSIQRSLAEVRAGRQARLTDDLPRELAPLAAELNALLDHNDTSVERTRRQMGDLAHALKTPIAVIANAAEHVEDATGETLREQVSVMSGSVNHHLARARAAGSARIIGARTPVYPVVDALHQALARIHAGGTWEMDVSMPAEISFRGERQDLEEMLGNIMENACNWSHGHIRVSGEQDGGELLIVVDDDGPGIRSEDRQTALDRGGRLDETVPGNGLGLSIVRDIAGLYDGALQLTDSPLGGLSARLRLPAT